jgi:predicted component of type VI protein secretion system
MKLRLEGPDEQQQELHLTDSSIKIGREHDNDLVLDDRTVSRHHCTIRLDDEGAVTIEDAGSRYGTVVNGRRIKMPSAFAPGDVVEIGGWKARLLDEQTAEFEVEMANCPTDEMEATRLETPGETRRTRVVLPPEPRRHSPGYIVLLVTLAAVAGILLTYVIIDSLG